MLKTPAFDRLHGESVRFTDFHSAPMCTPTRGQLLSGQDALHNGATSVTAGRAVLRRGLPTMADIFAANGYSTGIFGKWHLGDNYPYRPMDRGFQEAKYFFGWGLSSAPEFDNDYFDGRYRDNGVGKRFSGYCTDFWFGEAMKWMGERQRTEGAVPLLSAHQRAARPSLGGRQVLGALQEARIAGRVLRHDRQPRRERGEARSVSRRPGCATTRS